MILSEFYKELLARLTAEVAAIKHIDLYNGQFDQEINELPFSLPAVFIEFSPLDFQTLGKNKQSSNMGFNLHIGSEVAEETASRESDTIRDAGLAHLTLLDNIFAALQGWGGTDFGSIDRTALNPDQFHDIVRVHIMSFRTRITDKAAMITTQTATPAYIVERDLKEEA